MASAAIGQGVSGAASGAVAGSMILPGVGTAIGAGIGFLGGLISGSSADSQFANQMAWANYNRQSQYNTDIYNIQTGLAIAGVNAGLAMMSARYNAGNILNAAAYNAQMIRMTTEYNTELLENELVRTWNGLGLDIKQINMFRERERGSMIANQGASGTVIGTGSNAAVVQDQMSAEAMDISVVQFNADRQAANISNEMAQGIWQGEVAMQQTIWEGNVAAHATVTNAKIQAFGGMATATLQAGAGMYNAKQAHITGGYNIQQAGSQNSAQNKQDMIAGLFSAAGSYATYSYGTASVGGRSTSGGGSSYNPPSNYSTSPPLAYSPGTSLVVA